jgi:hypothetical protein
MKPDVQTYKDAPAESWTPDDVMCHPWLTTWDNTKCTKCIEVPELFGKIDGTCKGAGGSMHIFDPDTNFQGGWALAFETKTPKKKELSRAFCPSIQMQNHLSVST